MASLVFNGGSDDLVGVSLTPDNGGILTTISKNDTVRVQLVEEFNVSVGYNEFVVSVDDVEQFAVFARYGDGGSWGFGVSQVDEDVPLPSSYVFTVSQSELCDYSAELTIEFTGQNVTVREVQ